MINRLLWLSDHPQSNRFLRGSRVAHFFGLDVSRDMPFDHPTMEADMSLHTITTPDPWPEALAFIVEGFVVKLAGAHDASIKEYRRKFGDKPEHLTLFLDGGFRGGRPENTSPAMWTGEEGCWSAALRFGLAASDVPPIHHAMARWASTAPLPFMRHRLEELRGDCLRVKVQTPGSEGVLITNMLWAATGIGPAR